MAGSNLRALVSGLVDLIFPEFCLLCGTAIGPDRDGPYPVCGACAGATREEALEETRRCRVCSAPLLSEFDTCMGCRAREYAFHGNHSLFAYRGRAKELVYQYKFRSEARLSRFFADLLAERYRSRFDGMPIVPVPARRRARKRRGWDHVELICRSLRKRHGLPVAHALRRVGGKAQKRLNYHERARNMRGRIRLLRPAASFLRLRPAVVLLDDIFTTGATTSECAAVLRSAGVVDVHVLTIALD